MSVNLTVTLPVDTVAALQQAAAPGVDRTNMSDAMNKAVRAVLKAAGGLPYQLSAKTPSPEPPMQIAVGQAFSVDITRTMTMADVADLVQDKGGVPPEHQILRYDHQVLFNGPAICDSEAAQAASKRTVEEVGLQDGTKVHLEVALPSS